MRPMRGLSVESTGLRKPVPLRRHVVHAVLRLGAIRSKFWWANAVFHRSDMPK